MKLTVLVAPQGSLLASFDNNGIADDTQVNVTNFDGAGNSYSAEALAAAGLNPGKPVTVGGITYTWPLPAPGYPDNTVAAGQKVTVSAPAGTQQVGLLGSADGGPSKGIMTLNYSDGSTAQFWLGLSDWTLGAGKSTPSFGNGNAATLSYRDCSSCAGGKDATATHVFSTVFPVDPAKTLTSVTLPDGTDQGRLHIFAVGTSTTAPTGAVTTSATPSPAAAGQQVTVHGSGFGATQGTGYVAFSDQGINWGAPGNSAAFTVDSWSDTAVTFTVPTPSGTNGMFHVYPGTNAAVTVVNAAGQVSDSQVLPMTPTANPADYYNNIGTSADANQQCANFDGDGYSYSAEALAAAGIKPGGTVTSNGVTYTWPNVQACGADNILPAGQDDAGDRKGRRHQARPAGLLHQRRVRRPDHPHLHRRHLHHPDADLQRLGQRRDTTDTAIATDALPQQRLRQLAVDHDVRVLHHRAAGHDEDPGLDHVPERGLQRRQQHHRDARLRGLRRLRSSSPSLLGG